MKPEDYIDLLCDKYNLSSYYKDKFTKFLHSIYDNHHEEFDEILPQNVTILIFYHFCRNNGIRCDTLLTDYNISINNNKYKIINSLIIEIYNS